MERAPSGRPFNICSGRPVRVGDLLDELLRQSHVAVRVVVEAERLRPSDAAVFVGSAARIEQEIGWRPELTLTQTLGDTLEWWRQRVTFV
jgi:GDP-4-dehydro-6-deoxy-D-mannose reductase